MSIIIFVTDQLIEAQLSPESTLLMKVDIIEILFQYKEAFPSNNEPIGAIESHEVSVILNVERPYPTLARRPSSPASHRDTEQ
ncbi:hypothetical protein O181_059735 [Austropuccinia psidii MF-1]|uniref:Uncharacterized protein n=1 Tax=Austropuccinia psidii MF-1 TaxID=1389203 RepID=A0A9Q3EC12_9BASI|nr:hypothetical protein [Austropuccinia psidii MF-1]